MPDNFNIKITGPKGLIIIIIGERKQLINQKKQDFEVVKRKYKNVIDIIAYDNLLQRLKFTISQIKKSYK
ncbi:DUF4263 domain-containing protein [Myroides marinus]|nr:DUF4263 domain-containing protein [Myroides marinus]MDM1388256.1 DUF4263 domain-containing protein [Myroides marinus]MDM1395469.1 DUF4263 domain-containing protein [Myroides marinus]